MKKLIILILAITSQVFYGQSRKAPRMAPVYADAYYVTTKNDTIRGEVQVNPEDETEFYRQFAFRLRGKGKPRIINTQRAKAYGFDNREFVMKTIDGEKLFLERLAEGRLNFFEYRYLGKIDGYPAIESAFYIKDNDAEGEDIALREIKQISNKFYKRSLKPYMKDQPMIWADLDKFTFDRNAVLRSIREFNNYYVKKGN